LGFEKEEWERKVVLVYNEAPQTFLLFFTYLVVVITVAHEIPI
jgi:hypothetical protein